MQLFDAQTSNGASTTFEIIALGFVNVYVTGTFGGGTVAIQAQAPDGTWVDISGGDFASPGMRVIEAAPLTARLNLTGATSPNISAWVEGPKAWMAEPVGRGCVSA